MKKILSLLLTLLVLCMAGSALADGTHTVVDHGGNEVEVPDHITRVVIDQIPILSTYMSYFGGEAPYIVGFCGSFKTTISETVLKNIAPELMETADTVYAQSDLNIEEIMKLEPDVILYNANNASHAEILKASGIPCVGFATVGASTEADPIERYAQWLKLLEDVFGESDCRRCGSSHCGRAGRSAPDRDDSLEVRQRRADGFRQGHVRHLLAQAFGRDRRGG